MQPANPAANAAANAPGNPVANASANAPTNAPGNAANNAANAANIQGNPAPNPRRNAGAQRPPVQADRVEGSRRHRIRDEVEIARRANYDREHGVPDALAPTTLSKLQISRSCTTRNSCDVPNMTKTMALPTTSTLSLLIMPHQQALERSTISQLSHDVSG
jgi:hypothetical protein